jgi:hypothetical protein
MRARACWRLIVLALAVAGCASTSPIGAVRFQAEAPVWRVNDRKPQEKPPAARRWRRLLNKVDNAIVHRAMRALELRASSRAKDINSLEEVPDSTWFTNRIGVRALSIDELRRGPNTSGSPFDHLPWTITGGKIGGSSLGFTFEDARGHKFLVKFDAAAYPELETAAHIISHRILWAVGYNVPEDYLGYVRRSDLRLSAKLREGGIDDAVLDAALKTVTRRDDGSIRVLASRFVPGKPIGPYPREGIRRDDRNDVIPHQLRRSIRGQYSIFAWLDHVDVKDDNTLDAFADGHVTHYLVDFGKALGAMAAIDHDITSGYEPHYDVVEGFKHLVTFGLRTSPWEGKRRPALRGVGLYDSEHFDPGSWSPYVLYSPYFESDRFDAFWGAKLVMRFAPQELAAIVDEAKLSDPRAARYLVDTLVARQRATGRYWFDRVAPLDAFAIESTAGAARLCFTDLTLYYQLRDAPARYTIGTYDRRGASIQRAETVAAGPRGRTCAAVRLSEKDPDRYTIVRLQLQRGGETMRPVVVHVAKLRDGRLEVVGLRRR